MQSKDTSRQFDNVMAELNHQKSEIKRLNDMYLKMLTSFSDSQKLVGSSKSNSNYYSNKSRESSKPCGCSFSNECKISNKHNTPTEKNNNNSNNACACSFNRYVRQYQSFNFLNCNNRFITILETKSIFTEVIRLP